jgi:hypothetical protein
LVLGMLQQPRLLKQEPILLIAFEVSM